MPCLLALGQPCARSCARLAGVVVQPRQAGAALGPHRHCPPGRIGAGPARAEECQSGLSTRVASGERPAAALASPWQNAWAATKGARPTSAGRVLSISPSRGIDLDTLDAVALPPDCLVGSLPAALAQSVLSASRATARPYKWATAAARRGTRAAARTAARTARTVWILRPATPCRCAAGASPTTPASRGSWPRQDPSASRRRSRAPSASSTSS